MCSSEWLREKGAGFQTVPENNFLIPFIYEKFALCCVPQCVSTRLTFLGYDNAEQWIGWRDSFVEVVVIVDWKEVSVDVGVSQQHVDTGDVMDGLEEEVELLEATWAIPL